MSSSTAFDKLYHLQPPTMVRSPIKRMEVLCLGLSRSGTDSLRSALMVLGYEDVYHGFAITANQRNDCTFWVPLMRRKIENSHRPLTSVDFDSVLASCEAVTDGPANVFGEELMSYYPRAKVILNRRRDVDAWYSSMKKTCLQVFSPPMWVLSWFDARIYWLWQNFDLVMRGYYDGDFEKHGKRVSVEHYKRLEKALKESNREYLDWSVEDGWEPLCKFLGKPIPNTPFPDGNKGGGQFEQNMEEAMKDLVFNAFRNMGICLLGAIVLGLAFKYGYIGR